jgi:serine/threonine protein kinase/formylglycine-generating enzyme required for sulfatase activity
MLEPTPASSETWSPPKSFDEYRILRPLGRGGMGEVYLAHDMVLDRPVAVKFISALDPAPGALEQFLIEARAAARLQHPNVLTIYRVGELDDRPFIISEFIRGRGLDTIVKPMPWKRALDLGIGLSRGLAAAHRKGVLHRDIKPGNAIIGDDGTVKLLDFGLAKLMDRAALQAELGAMELAPISRDAPTIAMLPPALEDERALFGIEASPDRTAPMESGERTSTQPPRDPSGPIESGMRTSTQPPQEPSGPVENGMRSSTQPSQKPGPRISTERSVRFSARRGPDAITETPAPSSRSDASMIRGTPHYMAPELWRSEPATRRSDVYSLGALLYELCTGAPPHMQVPLYELPRAAVRRDAPPLKQVAPSVDPRLATVIDKCLRRDPAERYASGDELREALEQIVHQARRDSLPEGNPYRGLLSFEAEHRSLFFGRSTEIGTILERLRSDAVIVVVGESGVGKSSLCKAGALPLVADGGLGGTRQWGIVSLVPGRAPVDAIAGAFAGMLRTTPAKLADKLRAKPASLARNVYRQLGDSSGLVVFIDQLEELVTLSNPADVPAASEAIASLATNVPGIRLLMTARSDLLARVASLPNLGDEVPRALYFLRPLSPEKIREAIVGPARAKGVSFESEELIQTLVDSTARAEGGLPLLQFALSELWEARANPREPITAQSLEAIGGVTGALTRHADTVLASLPQEQHAAARKILTAMVTVDGTLARRGEDELLAMSDRAREALDALVRGRLLVAREAGGAPAYEVAHEALIKNWAVLRDWLDEQLEGRVVRQRLEAAAAEWERLGRTPEELWSARQLAEATGLDLGELGARDAAFLEASKRAVRRARVLRTIAIAAAPVVFAMFYGAAKISAGREQARRVGAFVSESNELRTEARQKNDAVEDLRSKAFAAFKARSPEEGERSFDRAIELSAEVERIQGRASQALEAALTIAGDRTDVRDMLGDVLYERALTAERDRRFVQLDDLLQRMTLYDASGERRGAWNAPAELTIESSPPGATVTIAPNVTDERGKLHLGKARDLGASPVSGVTVARGTYLLTLTARGRAEVRYPVLLSRGERLRVSVKLLEADAIPPGFIYVPAGRFLFGSTADKLTRRQFLEASPAHEVTTGSYLIAQRETTYGEWIEYLRALPPEERARRSVKLGSTGLSGSLDLTELPNGVWKITMQPTAQEYSARAGEMILYRGRQHRAAQDWLRMPVGGLSAEDAIAYAAWLKDTGRVPGARLCNEHEWERAARGADEREFPHSSDLLDPDDANIDETYGRVASAIGPDEVGAHLASRSPFGADDMVGNILEWARSSLTDGQMVVRGGGYYFGPMTARSTNRNVLDASLRDVKFGVRVCASIADP